MIFREFIIIYFGELKIMCNFANHNENEIITNNKTY